MTEVIEKAENKKGYKKTKLGWIPEDWKCEKFGDVFEFLLTGNNSRSELLNKGVFQYIHYGDIHCKYKNILDCEKEKIPYISEDKIRNLPFLKNGDLIFVDASEDYEGITKCTEIQNINNRKIISGLHTILLRPSSKILLSYGFAGYLASNPHIKKCIQKNANGWKVYGISKENLAKINLLLPPIEEQERIVNILSTWDEGIEVLEKLIEKKQNQKHFYLLELFSEDFLKTISAKKYKIKDFLIDYSKKTTINNQYEVLSSTKEGVFLQSEYFNREIASENNIGYKILKLNQIVLSPQNLWMGNINFNDKYEIGMVSPSYKIFDISPQFDKKYISYLLKTPRAFYEFVNVSEQGASIVRRNLNIELFEEITFNIPSKEYQQKIANILNTCDKEIKLLNSKLDKLKEQKKGLIQKLLTGEIRVKV